MRSGTYDYGQRLQFLVSFTVRVPFAIRERHSFNVASRSKVSGHNECLKPWEVPPSQQLLETSEVSSKNLISLGVAEMLCFQLADVVF